MTFRFEPCALAIWKRLDSATRADLHSHLERIAASRGAGAGVLATPGLTIAFRIEHSDSTIVVTHLDRGLSDGRPKA